MRIRHQVEIAPGIKAYGAAKIATLKALLEHGPMTRIVLERMTGIPKASMGQVISSLHKRSARYGKRVHIVGWERDAAGHRKRYPRAVYAFGPGRDMPKPWAGETRYEQMRDAQIRYRARHALRRDLREASVIGSALRARDDLAQAFFGMVS